MWILHLLPESFILIVVYCLISVGLLGMIASWAITFIPFLNIHRTWIQLVSVVLLASGLYWYGGYANELSWRERVAEMEEKVRQAEEKSKQAGIRIYITKSQKIPFILSVKLQSSHRKKTCERTLA